MSNVRAGALKPTYLGFDEKTAYMSTKDMLKNNLIPLAGYFRYTTQSSDVGVYRLFLGVYARRKGGIVWPDEMEVFNSLYRAKHPELMSNKTEREMHSYEFSGCYWNIRTKRAQFLFGGYGIFRTKAFTPRPEDRKSELLDLINNRSLRESAYKSGLDFKEILHRY